MKHHLNYSKEDPNHILLSKIFKIIGSRKSKTIIASKGVRNINMTILSIKIIFTAIFFNITIEFVVSELKRDKKLQKFFKTNEVPNAVQISEFISRFKPETFLKITNSILMQTKPIKRRGKRTFIVDATPVNLDYNIQRKHRSKEYLKKRRIIRKGDTLLFDKGYYKYENYQIGISKYKIVPLIFPKENFKIQKLDDKLTYPLQVFKDKKTETQSKKTIQHTKKGINPKNRKNGNNTNQYVAKSKTFSNYANQD